MRRLVAPIFALLVLAFVAFGGLTIAGVAMAVNRGDPGHGDHLALGPWQVWALAVWLGVCAALVVGGSFVDRQRRVRRR